MKCYCCPAGRLTDGLLILAASVYVSLLERERGGERERERERDRQTDRQTDRDREDDT